MNIKYNKQKKAFTLAELAVAMGMMVLLSGAVYSIFSSVRKSFSHAQNKLDILQTTRIIMSGLRNELRNAIDKPQVFNDRLNIPLSETRTVQYYYNEENRRIYKGEKGALNDPDPDISEMKAFLFDDGQILSFDYDSSYKDTDAVLASELNLNTRVWFKVSIKILYSEKFDKLSEEDKAKILANPDDSDKVKSFFMMITPRKVNWLLQASQ